MSWKIFGNDTIGKNKVTITLKKSTYIGMCIQDLSNILIYEFHYDYGDKSRLDTDSLMNEIKFEDVYEDFSNDREMFDFNKYSTNLKHYNNSNKLNPDKIKDKTGNVVIKEFLGLKPKLHSILVDDSRKDEKAKDVNKDVVGKTLNEYKDVLFNPKYLRHSMDRI